ncbi:hypothetical protein UMC2_14331 [[Clostridium] sordellii]|uniref:pyocin knob domain-containing protein n=1 Tax=Paraclostridium sordellii TaxID=1505 RepID=UPI0005421D60|nr:pyocin knob domain-containing protein [Paeniclostridium sordellii]CEK34183.1 hypothetical protein UMC2_14331 [[Clostridium] sordellii] [Paeniclostridium sordellii]
MANIKQYTDNIRKAIYGKEVRESLATGIEVINTEVEKNTTHVDKTVKDIEKFKNDINLAESQRVSAENKRISDEKIRVINEETRKEEFKKIVDENSTWDKKLSNLYNTNNSSLTDLNKSFKSKYDNLEKEYAKEITNVKDAQGQPGVSYKVNSLGVHPSSNGFITDVVLKGKTLINIMPMNSSDWKINGDGLNAFNYIRLDSLPVKPNTKYSYKLFNLPDKYDSHWFHLLEPLTTKDKKGTFTSISNIGRSYLHLYPKEGQKFTLEEVKDVKILLVEGEHDLNRYFEGMKSVGDDGNKVGYMKLLTRKEDGNLFDKTQIISGKIVSGANNSTMGIFIDPAQDIDKWNVTNYIPIFSNEIFIGGLTSSIVSGNNINYGAFYDENKNTISVLSYNILNDNFKISVPQNAKYFAISVKHEDLDNLYICNNPSKLTNHKSEKNQLLFLRATNEWDSIVARGINDDLCDLIEGRGNSEDKYIKKCEPFKYKGIEEWIDVTGNVADYKRFKLVLDNKAVGLTNIKCNLFPTKESVWADAGTEEGICGSTQNGSIYIRIKASRLSTSDKNGFKKWLSENNLEGVFELHRYESYKCIGIKARSWDKNTLVNIESGPIKPDIECYMPHSVLSSLKGISDKLECVDENVIKLLIEVANKANKEHDHNDKYLKSNLGMVSNFNDCKESGMWRVNGESISNAPYSGAISGTLEVLNAKVNGEFMQRFTSTAGEVFFRCYRIENSTWSTWTNYLAQPFQPFRGHATDFNLCTKPGRYTVNSYNTIPNSPYSGGIWGYLDVIMSNEKEIIQKFTVSGPGSVYTRIYNVEHKWFNWVKTPTVEDFECKNGQSGGYQKFPNGIMIQWGSTVIPFDGYRAHGYLYYPIAFKEYVHCCGNVASNDYGGFCETSGTVVGDTLSRAYAEALDVGNGNKQGHNVRFQWIAIGK